MEFELVEMTPEQREMALYEEAVEHFGEKAQILQAVEEMAELTKALVYPLQGLRPRGPGRHSGVHQ